MKRLLTLQKGFSFQLCSDIHLEFCKRLPKPDAIIRNPGGCDVLFLAGDICRPFSFMGAEWLDQVCASWKHVVYVNGNHEFYQSNADVKRGKAHSVSETRVQMQDIATRIDNLDVLDPGVIEIGGVRVIGATLWSYIPIAARPAVSRRLNDYALSFTSVDPYKNLTVEETVAQHEEELAFITNHISEAKEINQPVVVVTHHAPSLTNTSAERYQGVIQNPTTHAFATDLQYLFKHSNRENNSTVEWWLSGHTHHNFEADVLGTRLYSNQRGYNASHTGNKYRKDDVKSVI